MFQSTNFTSSPLAPILYPGLDFDALNIFEQCWVNWYLWVGDVSVATGLAAFLMHEIVYFGRCVPWMVVDAIPYFRRWKLQPGKIPSVNAQWECTKFVLLTHFTVELPEIWLFHPLAEFLGMKTHHVPFPPASTFIPQIAIFFVLEDIWHYFAHSFLHRPWMYKYVHKLHHKHSAPFGLAAEYAHPAEILILGIGTIGGPLLYCWWSRNLHFITVYMWITLRLFQAVDAHSGYDFPWSLQHIIPFWAGADHHDFHHMAFVNNFSTSFRWCDWFFGTDTKYRDYKKRSGKEKAEFEKRVHEEGLREEGVLGGDEEIQKKVQ